MPYGVQSAAPRLPSHSPHEAFHHPAPLSASRERYSSSSAPFPIELPLLYASKPDLSSNYLHTFVKIDRSFLQFCQKTPIIRDIVFVFSKFMRFATRFAHRTHKEFLCQKSASQNAARITRAPSGTRSSGSWHPWAAWTLCVPDAHRHQDESGHAEKLPRRGDDAPRRPGRACAAYHGTRRRSRGRRQSRRAVFSGVPALLYGPAGLSLAEKAGARLNFDTRVEEADFLAGAVLKKSRIPAGSRTATPSSPVRSFKTHAMLGMTGAVKTSLASCRD